MSDDKGEVPARLAAVREQFAHWRATRSRLCRIPAELWDAAVGCAAEYGVNRSSRVLGLDFVRLKKRLRAARGEESASPRPTFVELPRVAGQLAECIVEVENAGGSRLRLELRGTAIPDPIELVHSFTAQQR